MCVSKPKAPKQPDPVAPPPPPVTQQEADVEARRAQDEDSKRARVAKGRASTILTGPLASDENAKVQRKALLGQ